MPTTPRRRRPAATIGLELAVFVPVLAVVVAYAAVRPGQFDHPMLLAWAASVALMDLLPVPSAGQLQLSLSFPILLAVGLLYPPPVAAATALVGSFDPREINRSLPPVKALFVRAEIALSVLAGSTIFHTLANIHSEWQLLVPALLAAVGVDYVVNISVVALYTAIDRKESFRDALAKFHVGKAYEFVVSYMGLALSALVIARLYLSAGPWAVVFFFGPLLLARQMFLRTRELEQAAAELREAEAKYRTLVEQIPAVTYIRAVEDPDPLTRRQSYVSPQIERMLGFTPREWLSEPRFWTARLHPDDRRRAVSENDRTDASGQPYAQEYRLLASDDRTVWIHDEAVLLHDDEGRPAYWHGVMLDISALKEAEEERRRLLDRTVEATEEERRRIAAELHDGPIQHLAAVVFRLENLRAGLARSDLDGLAEAVSLTQDELRGEIVELRRLVSQLRPPILDQLGLEDALRDHVDAIGRDAGLECTMALGLGGRLDPDLETVVYRVSQEALSNVIKHARARHVWVSLDEQDGSVSLEVRDDGIGFLPARRGSGGLGSNGNGDHIGLIAMRERVEAAGGRWELESRPGGGTSVRAIFPRRPVPARV